MYIMVMRYRNKIIIIVRAQCGLHRLWWQVQRQTDIGGKEGDGESGEGGGGVIEVEERWKREKVDRRRKEG